MTRVLFFDVFGTVVDWRSGVLDACRAVQERSAVQERPAAGADWPQIVDDWRRAYPSAMLAARSEPEWQNLDRLQARTLDDVLTRHRVEVSAPDRDLLVRSWRRLPAWPDSAAGLAALRSRFVTATLSNGHVALLVDLLRFAGVQVDAVLSAELAQSYKPDPTVYRTAAALLECPIEEAAMVAAHPSDLEAAAALGMRPVFVRRPHEWGPDTDAPEPPELPGLVVVDGLDEIDPALG